MYSATGFMYNIIFAISPQFFIKSNGKRSNGSDGDRRI